MTLQELGNILNEMYNNADSGLQVATVHIFGIKYGKEVMEKGFKAADIIGAARISQSYSTELSKGLKIYKCLNENTFGISLNDMVIYDAKKEDTTQNIKAVKEKGSNMLIYGVPGCGKSHYIKNNFCDQDRFMERVVFHPDYTYSDFVGQILPQIDESGRVQYRFIPGPFTRILKSAYDDSENMYYLIIEEINRGNASAILGDLFQLLDRNDFGESEYAITNYDISKIIYNDEGMKKIKIPSNLSVIATMNTSDQNVFTLDTAFKRRWNMKLIQNDLDKPDYSHKRMFNSKYTWYSFASAINDLIIEENAESSNSEDKCLGAFFVKKEDVEDSSEGISMFAEKVLMYLWNDVFRYNRDEVFKEEYTTLERIIKEFKLKKFEIFSEQALKRMNSYLSKEVIL